jgi:hypothetical protein
LFCFTSDSSFLKRNNHHHSFCYVTKDSNEWVSKRSDTTLEFSDSAVRANRVRNVGVTVNYSDGCFDFSSQMISKRGMNEETNRRRIPFLRYWFINSSSIFNFLVIHEAYTIFAFLIINEEASAIFIFLTMTTLMESRAIFFMAWLKFLMWITLKKYFCWNIFL